MVGGVERDPLAVTDSTSKALVALFNIEHIPQGGGSVFEIEKLGERGDGLLPACKPSIGRWDVEGVTLDELLRQPDQRELMGDRILVQRMFHAP